ASANPEDDGAVPPAQRQPAGRLPAAALADADLPGAVLGPAGEHHVPAGALPVDPQPGGAGHAVLVGRVDPDDQRPGQPGRLPVPGAVLQPAAAPGRDADAGAAADDDA